MKYIKIDANVDGCLYISLTYHDFIMDTLIEKIESIGELSNIDDDYRLEEPIFSLYLNTDPQNLNMDYLNGEYDSEEDVTMASVAYLSDHISNYSISGSSEFIPYILSIMGCNNFDLTDEIRSIEKQFHISVTVNEESFNEMTFERILSDKPSDQDKLFTGLSNHDAYDQVKAILEVIYLTEKQNASSGENNTLV